MTKKYKSHGKRKFQELTAAINEAIIKNEGLIGDQKEQVKLVMSLERRFQHWIQKYQKTVEIYDKFINHILNENGNILSARPYFREKADVFSSGITKAIKERKPKDLAQFNINYQLIAFIVENWGGPLPERADKYYKEFIEARRILIENNLPLAINRAKLFFRKTPRSSITLLDLIDICTYGLISGVDKYVGEYTKIWRSVCIGRMVGFMIEEYSKTFLRMFPTDRKILYRANALKYRLKIENVAELTDAVNKSFEKDREEGRKVPNLPISEMHIRTLQNGCHYIPVDNTTSEEDDEGNIGLGVYDYTADPKQDVEKEVSDKQLMKKVIDTSEQLQTIERKLIKLKGVDI